MDSYDSKYIVTEFRTGVGDAPWSPVFSEKEASRVVALDSNVFKGAFYMETAWFWPGNWTETKGEEGTVKEHSHPFPEALGFIGTDPNDVHNLGGEVELWIDGKQNIMTRSFIAFLPAGTKHCPMRIRKVEKPIFHFTAGMGTTYG
jgi:hypothetical protein